MPVSKQKKAKRKHSKTDKDSLHNPPLSVTTWGNEIKSGLLVCKTTIDDKNNIGVGYDRLKQVRGGMGEIWDGKKDSWKDGQPSCIQLQHKYLQG